MFVCKYIKSVEALPSPVQSHDEATGLFVG